MLSNNRVASDITLDLFWSKKTYLDIFIKAISSPFYVNTEINNYFGTQYYRTDQIALYTSALTVILLPQIFSIQQKKTKILLITFYGICFLLLLFEPGGSLMHGFSEASFRWTNFIILVNMIVCAHLLQYKSFNKLILLLTLFSVFFGVTIVFIIVDNPFQYFNQTIVVLISLVLMIIYSLILITINKPVIPIIILVLAEIAFTGKLTINSYIEKNSQTSYHYEETGIPLDYFEKLQKQQPHEFYRIYFTEYYVDIDHLRDFNYNSNMIYNYKGVFGYDSTFQSSLNTFLNWTGQYFWWFKETDTRIHDFLSVKYYVVQSPYELPHENFKLVEQIGTSDYYLYENLQSKPFGFTCNSLISLDEFYTYSNIYEIYRLIGSHIIVDQSLINQFNLNGYITPDISDSYLQNVKYTNNTICGEITTENKQILLLTIPYDKGWRIEVDGNNVQPLQVNGGFMAILLEEGNHSINMEFTPYGWNTGLITAGISAIALSSIIIKSRKTVNH